MARVLRFVGFCGFVAAAFVCGACGQGSISVPRGPAPDIETRALPLKQRHEIPRLIAPPPAYGNKIVLAHADAGVSVD